MAKQANLNQQRCYMGRQYCGICMCPYDEQDGSCGCTEVNQECNSMEMNKPVAWINLEAWLSGKYYPNDCFSDEEFTGSIPLYTHPVKELTELDYAEFLPIWKDFIKDAGSVLNVQTVAHHFYNLALRKAQKK